MLMLPVAGQTGEKFASSSSSPHTSHRILGAQMCLRILFLRQQMSAPIDEKLPELMIEVFQIELFIYDSNIRDTAITIIDA